MIHTNESMAAAYVPQCGAKIRQVSSHCQAARSSLRADMSCSKQRTASAEPPAVQIRSLSIGKDERHIFYFLKRQIAATSLHLEDVHGG